MSHLERDERARANRFVSARDRGRFVVGRAFLRMLLARHVGVPPGISASATTLRQARAHWRRPGRAGSTSPIRRARRVCRRRRVQQIGVDIERVRRIADAGSVSRAFLSPGELGRLAALPEPARLRAFYEAWTRKEALLKALGCGLNRPLVDLEVSFGPGEPARLLRSLSDPGEVERFSLHAFEPESGYVGAVALAGRALQVRQRTWRWA